VFSPPDGGDARPLNQHKGIDDMRSLKCFAGAALVLGLVTLGASNAADEKKPEFKSIKEVMKFAHDKDSGALAKAKAGTISDDDKKKLVAGYVALATFKPEKGDADNWKKLTEPIAAAAKAYGDGKDEKAAKLSDVVGGARGAQCMACHKAHR
jgi:hypothetical protein